MSIRDGRSGRLELGLSLEQILRLPPGSLRFVAHHGGTGAELLLQFSELEPQDLSGLPAEWGRPVFLDAWKAYAEAPQGVLKLIHSDASEPAILGLLRLGRIRLPRQALSDSLIEVAPALRYGARDRNIMGVGSILVARLAWQSFADGSDGRITVTAVPGSEGFYRKLGFRRLKSSRPNSRVFVLGTAEATVLLLARTRLDTT